MSPIDNRRDEQWISRPLRKRPPSPFVEHDPPFDPSYGESRRIPRQKGDSHLYVRHVIDERIDRRRRSPRQSSSYQSSSRQSQSRQTRQNQHHHSLLSHLVAAIPRPTFSLRDRALTTSSTKIRSIVAIFASLAIVILLASLVTTFGTKNIGARNAQSEGQKTATQERNRVTPAAQDQRRRVHFASQKSTQAYAFPLPAEYVNAFSPDQPHHDYPAVDIAIPQGTPMYAVHSGSVRLIDDRTCGLGVALQTSSDVVITYCHASTIRVTNGQRVKTGDLLGLSGGSPGTRGAGNSTGAHLHLQIVVNGNYRCPGRTLDAWANGRSVHPRDARC